jgi:hypothetical protein
VCRFKSAAVVEFFPEEKLAMEAMPAMEWLGPRWNLAAREGLVWRNILSWKLRAL